MNDKVINNLCRLCATQELDLNLLENDFDKGISKRKLLLTLVNKYLKIKVRFQPELYNTGRRMNAHIIRKIFSLLGYRCGIVASKVLWRVRSEITRIRSLQQKVP